MITKEADYALRAVVYLSHVDRRDDVVSTSKLAEEMEIPYRFLRKIIGRLIQADIVVSQRGKTGGVALARPPSEISLLDVIRTIDTRCMTLNTCLEDEANCSRSRNCPVHREMLTIQKLIDDKLEHITFDKL